MLRRYAVVVGVGTGLLRKWKAGIVAKRNCGNQLSNEGTLLVAQLVEALRCRPEGGGFESRWCHGGIFH